MAPAVPAAALAARRRNRRGEGDRLREEIITAASQMIGEAGDDSALTLRGVARRVGIAAPSIYRHFPDVDELKMAVVQRAFADFARARDAASADGDDPAARLLARCRAYTAFALANPGPYRYLFSQHAPTGDPARPPVDLPVFQALAESIRRCQQAGLARAGDDPQWLAAQVWAALHGLVLLRLNAPGFPWPGPLEQMADQAVARLIGLETSGTGTPPDRSKARRTP
jgi:AcrR family transcriptional regulator